MFAGGFVRTSCAADAHTPARASSLDDGVDTVGDSLVALGRGVLVPAGHDIHRAVHATLGAVPTPMSELQEPLATRFRTEIDAQADSVARLYLAGEELGQPATREQKEFIEGIVAADYDGRTVVELLQNGHDAHPRTRRDGVLDFLLDEVEGPHGTLYVANGGEPLTHDNFLAMCRVAMSDKRPDQGIGNKGVGFKSVLQLADSPEVYSAARAGAGVVAGYCFRFARPEDFDDIAYRVAPERAGFADELRDNVASLKVPIPIGTVPPVVAELATTGFSTVIRLPLRSPSALDRVRLQLAELTSSDVPFHLFLERVALITMRRRTEAGANEQRHELTRRTKSLGGAGSLSWDRVTLQDGTALVLVRKLMSEGRMLDAIARSRAEGGLTSGWDKWKGAAEVTVALPERSTLDDGRLFTFLPMGENATGPLTAFVNAPFFARLDRRSLDEADPLNDQLFTVLAELCAEAAVLAVSGDLPLDREQTLDLITWTTGNLPRLTSALEELGTSLEALPILPALGEPPRVPLKDSCFWRPDGTAFNAQSVAAAGVPGIIDPSLDAARTKRLLTLANDLVLNVHPSVEELAEFAERCAASLAADEGEWTRWADYYDDLANAFSVGEELANRRILLGEQGDLLVAADDADNGQVVFRARPTVDSASADEQPEHIRSRIAFMHPDIPWLTKDRKRRRGGSWLETERLLREYRTDAVIGLVGDAMRDVPVDDHATQLGCLKFAYAIWRAAPREVSAEMLRQANLLVRTKLGWATAGQAFFGPGWGGTTSDVDGLLARLVRQGSAKSRAVALMGDATVVGPTDLGLSQDADAEEPRRFLELLGVRHGLWPQAISPRNLTLSGAQLIDPDAAPLRGGSGIHPDQLRDWRKVASVWPRATPSYAGVEYRSSGPLFALPGQAEFGSLDPDAQRTYGELVIRGLDEWPDSALELSFTRATDPGVTVVLPSLAASFLATAAWVPQTTPGERATISLYPASRAWWLSEAETPDYLPAQPPGLRALATPRVLGRLRRIGIRFWDHPSSARSRLQELVGLVGSHGLEERAHVTTAVRKAYEVAWGEAVEHDEPSGHEILVSRQSRLTTLDLDAAAEVVYYLGNGGSAQERLLAQAPVPVLPVRDPRLSRRIAAILREEGVTCLRSAAEAQVTVTADDRPAGDAPAGALTEVLGMWLPLAVLGVLEFQYREFPPVTQSQLERASHELSRAEVVVADSVSTEIDGHLVDDARGQRSFLLETDSPRVVICGIEGHDPWGLAQAASAALAILVGFPGLADNIRLTLIDIERHCGRSSPTLDDLAHVLHVTRSELESLTTRGPAGREDLSRFVAALACVDVAIAGELQSREASFGSRDELQAWILERLPELAPTVDRLVALAATGDLLSVVELLNADLVKVNAALRALSLPPLHNLDGHHRQLHAYLRQQRAALHDHLRDRFLPSVREGAGREDYVRLRDFPGLLPAPEWLEAYWDVPESALKTRVDAWFASVCPPVEALGDEPLPPVDELRDLGRRTLSSVVGNARVLVEAWLHRHAGGAGPRPHESLEITERVTTGGYMDFGRLTTADVLTWLRDHEQWPIGMPLTTARADLGLNEDELAEARTRLELDREQRRREATYVEYAGRTYTDEVIDLRALADAVRQDVSSEVLDVPINPAELLTCHTPGVVKGSGGGRGTGGGGKATGVSSEKAKSVGLAGEVVVGEWLRHLFDLPPEDTWVSGYRRDVLADGVGDDGLGYDFRVELSDRTWLIESKATTGGDGQFTLSEAEVTRAGDLGPGEEYVIAFVTDVLDPDRRRVHSLPNPLAPGGLHNYHVVGRAMRLKFDLLVDDESNELGMSEGPPEMTRAPEDE